MLAVQPRMQRGVLVLLLLAATACAPMDWTRAEASPAQLAADLQACRNQAWRESTWASLNRYYAGPSPYYDPFGRRLLGPYYSPFADPFGDRFFDEARLANFCMRAKGYELAPVTK